MQWRGKKERNYKIENSVSYKSWLFYSSLFFSVITTELLVSFKITKMYNISCMLMYGGSQLQTHAT